MNFSHQREKHWQNFIMKINYGYILSAGKGTRMGEVGKQLPKPLWPIFSKRLLDLQVEYCRELGIENIYINIHYLAEEILEHVKKNKDLYLGVTFLKEDPLLDSGGAIHNFAIQPEVNYRGNVLLLNADQFLLFDEKYIAKALEELKTNRASLFGIEVYKDDAYNETVVKENQLVAISKPTGLQDFWTYSGTGVLKLDGLKPVVGISKFFESVCNFKEETIHFVKPENYEYWDFGTLGIYVANILKIKKDIDIKKETQMIRFLKERESLKNVESFVDIKKRAIALDSNGNFINNGLTYKELCVEI